MCCGQKRSELRSAPLTATTPPLGQNTSNIFRLPGTPQQSLASAQLPHSTVPLRYSQNSPIRVRGPVTGRQYVFSAATPVQGVDPKDATTLLRTPFFRRA
jgi:hypothetical protein